MMCVWGVCVGVCVNGMNPSIIAKFILVLSMSLTYFCTTEQQKSLEVLALPSSESKGPQAQTTISPLR